MFTLDCIVFYTGDIASYNTFLCLAEQLSDLGFEKYESSDPNILESYKNNNTVVINSKKDLLHSEYLDRFSFESIYLMSKHVSSKQLPAFTTHATGNLTAKAEFGGKPFSLSKAAPIKMLSFLKELNKNKPSTTITYEATHHGPLLKTPSLFVEFGGTEKEINKKENAAKMKNAILVSLDAEEFYKKVALGLGSGHYPSNFTRFALSKNYAFSHIIPAYAISEYDEKTLNTIINDAILNSEPSPNVAVIDKKKLNISNRDILIKILEEKGLEHELL